MKVHIGQVFAVFVQKYQSNHLVTEIECHYYAKHAWIGKNLNKLRSIFPPIWQSCPSIPRRNVRLSYRQTRRQDSIVIWIHFVPVHTVKLVEGNTLSQTALNRLHQRCSDESSWQGYREGKNKPGQVKRIENEWDRAIHYRELFSSRGRFEEKKLDFTEFLLATQHV